MSKIFTYQESQELKYIVQTALIRLNPGDDLEVVAESVVENYAIYLVKASKVGERV